MQTVSFTSEGQTVRGTLYMPDSQAKVPGVIFFHGMTSSENGYLAYAEHLASLGFAALTVNLRGHGTSDGDFNKLTVGNLVNDGVAAFDFLQNVIGIDKSRIGLFGSSVGTTVVSHTALERGVKSLVFRAPAAYTQDMMKMTLQETMETESSLFQEKRIKETVPFQALEKFQGSLLIVASEKDQIIPASTSEILLSSARMARKKKLVVIPGATHQLTNPDWKKQLLELLSDWFQETL